jgi:hypothetical protein
MMLPLTLLLRDLRGLFLLRVFGVNLPPLLLAGKVCA